VGVIQMGTVDSGPGTTNELHGPGGGLASGLKECSMNPANATGSGFLGGTSGEEPACQCTRHNDLCGEIKLRGQIVTGEKCYVCGELLGKASLRRRLLSWE